AWRTVLTAFSAGSRSIIGWIRFSSPKNRKCTSGKRWRAISAPRITISGALSPPIASREIARLALTPHLLPGYRTSSVAARLGGAGRRDFPAVVVAAGAAHVMRALQLTAIRALGGFLYRQRVMAAAHALARTGYLLFRNCHGPV